MATTLRTESIRAKVADLRAQAAELAQSDSALQLALSRSMYAEARELEQSLLIPVVAVQAIDTSACAAAVRAAERDQVMASASPRLRAALADIAAGRLPSSHLRP